MNRPVRIGILGGTFDPIHSTHLEIALRAREAAHLDQVWFVIAAEPPHKRGEVFASPEERLAMVEAAVRDEPGFLASRLELDRRGPSYTADTLQDVHAAEPDAQLFFIVGYDSLVDFHRWRAPQEILSLARLLVVRRPGVLTRVAPMLDGHYDEIAFAESLVSSTEIRTRLAQGLPVDTLIPPAVEAYIREKGLYGTRA